MLEHEITTLEKEINRLNGLDSRLKIIAHAIEEAAKIPSSRWAKTRSRERRFVICKEIFCYHVKKERLLSYSQMGKMINRCTSDVHNLIKKYKFDYETSTEFRKIADLILDKINPTKGILLVPEYAIPDGMTVSEFAEKIADGQIKFDKSWEI